MPTDGDEILVAVSRVVEDGEVPESATSMRSSSSRVNLVSLWQDPDQLSQFARPPRIAG